MKMTGPLAMTVLTTSVDKTTIRTEQSARQKWHFLLPISYIEYLRKNLKVCQQLSPPWMSSKMSLGTSVVSVMLLSLSRSSPALSAK